jgi:thymidylate kinase
MKIIILEGIATSGKTSIIKYISEFFGQNNYSFTVIGEDKTLMPILHNQDKQVSIDLLKLVINQALVEDKEFIKKTENPALLRAGMNVQIFR